MTDEIDPRIPNTSTAWQLWHTDTFDPDAPTSLQVTGMNIVHGLYELWLYTLNEAIGEDGNASFSRFHLTWGDTPVARVGVLVNPFNNLALLKLRHWTGFMSGDQEREDIRIGQTVEEQKHLLLLRLAQLHYELLQKSMRWTASTIDWNAEAREILARVGLISNPDEL